MCGITTSGEEECYWDCHIEFTDLGPKIANPKCLLDCFEGTNCVDKLLDDPLCSDDTIIAVSELSCIKAVYRQPPIVTNTIEGIVRSKCFSTLADIAWLCFSSVEIFADEEFNNTMECIKELTDNQPPPIVQEQPTCDTDLEQTCYEQCNFVIRQGTISNIRNPDTCLTDCFEATSCVGMLLGDLNCMQPMTSIALNETSCISSLLEEQPSFIFNSIYDIVRNNCSKNEPSVAIEWFCFIAFEVFPSSPIYENIDDCRMEGEAILLMNPLRQRSSEDNECFYDCIFTASEFGKVITNPDCLRDCFLDTPCVGMLLDDPTCCEDTEAELRKQKCIQNVYQRDPIHYNALFDLVKIRCLGTEAERATEIEI